MLHVTVSKPVVNLTENLYYMCDILQVLCKCNVVSDYSIAFSVHSPGIMFMGYIVKGYPRVQCFICVCMSSWTSCRVQDAAVPAYTSKSLNKGDLKLCYYMPIILNMLGNVVVF